MHFTTNAFLSLLIIVVNEVICTHTYDSENSLPNNVYMHTNVKCNSK